MNIHYITRMNFASAKAHVYNTTRTCEAVSGLLDAHITLVSSDSTLTSPAKVAAFFKKNGVTTPFTAVSLNSPSRFFSSSTLRVANYCEVLVSNITLLFYVITHRKDIDVIYFRDPLVALPVLFAKKVLRKPIFFEIHAVLVKKSTQKMAEYLTKISDGIIPISHGLDAHYYPLNSNSIILFCAAAEPERFSHVRENIESLRKKLGLPIDATILCYSGNLYRTGNNDSYGIEDIVQALPLMPQKVIFVGVGKKGNETDELEAFGRRMGVSDRIVLIPWVSRDKVAEYLLAADILVIPSAGGRIGNSPSKMFEYLVSGRPIIAAQTEAISEVLRHDRNSLLVEYRKPQAWAEAVMELSDLEYRRRLVAQAQEDGLAFTWKNRGQSIVQFIQDTITHI